MAETEDSQRNIAAIRTQLDNLERMTRLSIASNPNSQGYIEGIFGARAGSAELYLELATGPKTPEELGSRLGKSAATVSKVCSYLHENGLIERLVSQVGANKILWKWHEMERTLGISRVARRIAKASLAPKKRTDLEDDARVRSDG